MDSLVLGSSTHDQGPETFPLGKANAGEFQTEFLALDPAHDRLINPQGPFVITEKQRQFQDHPRR